MDYIEAIGSAADFIERRVNHPRLARCPTCQTKGRRVRIRSRRIHHVGRQGGKVGWWLRWASTKPRATVAGIFKPRWMGCPPKGGIRMGCAT